MPITPILSPLILCLPIRHICLRPSVLPFLPMEEGYFVHPLSVSLGGEGFDRTTQSDVVASPTALYLLMGHK